MASSNKGKVGIVGSGFIGRSWAMLFAGAGYEVKLYDIGEEQVKSALADILQQLKSLHAKGLTRGKQSVEEQYGLISGTTNLVECVVDAKFVQENAPESQAIKEKVFLDIDKIMDDKCVVASSSSSLPSSKFTPKMNHKSQCLIAHPTNPPFYCPVVEVVPAPYTSQEAIDLTMSIMKDIGQSPVFMKRELPGFIVNRMQCALMAECLRLLESDTISVEDLETSMKDGLGMRYAFIGAFETLHLNAEGFVSFSERYGKAFDFITQSFGPSPRLEGDTAKLVCEELKKRIPLDKLDERRKWRDTRLASLAKLKKDLDEQEEI